MVAGRVLAEVTARRIALALTAVVFALVNGCDKTPPIANSTDPQWVKQHEPHAKVALVFVHGLFGDTLGTWTASNGTTFFDLVAAEPEIGPKVDIFAFGFASNMVRSGSFSVGDAANRLSERLRYHKVLDYPAIVFVTHSMGGLVVLQALTTHRELVERVPLIVFYATPQEGSQITQIATTVMSNPGLVNMFPADKNLYLQTLNDAWKKMAEKEPHPRIRCAFEKRPTFGELIVPWSSATRFCDGTAAAIDADHMDIVKPDRAGHDSVVLLVNALNEQVLGKDLIGKLEIPDFRREGDHRVFTIDDPEEDYVARLINVGRGGLRYSFERSDPKLVIEPEQAQLGPGAEKGVVLFLRYGADKPEYGVVLHSDFGPVANVLAEQTRVLVRVPGLTAMHARQQQLATGVAEDLSNFLSDPDEYQRLRRRPASDPEVPVTIATVAHKSIAGRTELPETASWVLTADLFNAANWPSLSMQALRKAEESSAAVAASTSIQRVAATAAANSGESRIFRTAGTTPNAAVELASVHPFANATTVRVSLKLSRQLQGIPAVEVQGLTLEGDLKQLAGDTTGAREAYLRAAKLQNSPLIEQQLELLSARPERQVATNPQSTGTAPAKPDRADPLTLYSRRELKVPQLASTSEAKQLEMRNIGRTPLRLDVRMFSQASKPALRLLSDECSKRTLPPEQSCVIDVECVTEPSSDRGPAIFIAGPPNGGMFVRWEDACGRPDLAFSEGRPEDAELARVPELTRLEIRNIGKTHLRLAALQLPVSDPRYRSGFLLKFDRCSTTTLAPQQSCSIVIQCVEEEGMDPESHISIANSGDGGPLNIQWRRLCARPKAPKLAG